MRVLIYGKSFWPLTYISNRVTDTLGHNSAHYVYGLLLKPLNLTFAAVF